MRKMISASTALLVIWLPQLAPTNWVDSALGGMWKVCWRAVATLVLHALRQRLRRHRPLRRQLDQMGDDQLDGRVTAAVLAHDAGDLALYLGRAAQAPFGELEDRAALEVDREVQTAHSQGDRAHQHDEAGDRVPRPLAADEVDRDLAPVQPTGDTAAACHHASFEVEEPSAVVRLVGGRWARTVRLGARPSPGRLGAEPLRIKSGPLAPAAEELRPRQQGHHRLGEQEDHDDVDERGQAEGVGEALHVAGGEVVEQHRRQEGHRVGDQNRAPRPLPPGFDRRAERLAVPHLVTEPLEVDDERVRGDADRHHQAGDGRQGHGEVLVLAEQHDREVGEQPRDQQAGDRHQAEPPVVVEQVDHDQEQAEDAREQPRVKRGVADLR